MSKTIEESFGVGRKEEFVKRKPLPTEEELWKHYCKTHQMGYCTRYFGKREECPGTCPYFERIKREG